jgi:hypothetical protein
MSQNESTRRMFVYASIRIDVFSKNTFNDVEEVRT